MRTYISLCNFTQKGIEGIKEGAARLDAAKALFRAMGAEIKDVYLVTGRYDMVIISEVPDDETGARLALTIGSKGTIRTETLGAYTEDQYRKIIAALD